MKGQPKDHHLAKEGVGAEMKILSDLIVLSMRLSCEIGMTPF